MSAPTFSCASSDGHSRTMKLWVCARHTQCGWIRSVDAVGRGEGPYSTVLAGWSGGTLEVSGERL